MVLAGCVIITNPSYPTELNAANLVYEQVRRPPHLADLQVPRQRSSSRPAATITALTGAPTASATASSSTPRSAPSCSTR